MLANPHIGDEKMSTENIRLLKMMVKGSYDLQALRMQAGMRLCANFRAKLHVAETEAGPDDDNKPSDELSADALKIIDQLKDSYRRLTDGIARNRTIPTEKGFKGDELISDYTELMLVDQYIRLESQETVQFNQLIFTLRKIPIFNKYLEGVRGIGPTLAAVIITYLDPYQADYASSFWKYCGLDVGPDGWGRSLRAAHLVQRTYVDKNGQTATRMSATYDPWLKMKLLGVLGPSFLRSNSPWRKAFDDYKHRINSDPARTKLTVAEWKVRFNAWNRGVKNGEVTQEAMNEEMQKLWPPGRIKNAALRYMVKQFLADLWVHWRTLEGLPITESYAVGKLGLPPHHYGRAAE
jgi:hypothetical protein